jgi:hypothetical protein
LLLHPAPQTFTTFNTFTTFTTFANFANAKKSRAWKLVRPHPGPCWQAPTRYDLPVVWLDRSGTRAGLPPGPGGLGVKAGRLRMKGVSGMRGA